MDLDTSFALVSSLTPRSQAIKSVLTENNKLSSKSRKKKLTNKTYLQNQITKSSSQLKENENKENFPLKELMNKDECVEAGTLTIPKDSCNRKDSLNFPVDMANIAIRPKGPSRGRIKQLCSLSPIESRLSIQDDSDCVGSTRSQRRSSNDLSGACNVANNSITKVKKGIKRKSDEETIKISDLSDSTFDLVESSFSQEKVVTSEINKRLSIDTSAIGTVLTSPKRNRDVNDTSLSTAYDSGSFRATRRRGAKVIPETPESEESLKNNSSRKKTSMESLLTNSGKVKKAKERTSAFSSCSTSFVEEDSPLERQSANSSDQLEKENKKVSSISKHSFNEISNKKSVVSPASKEINPKTIKKDKPKGKESRNNYPIEGIEEFGNKKETKNKESNSNTKQSINMDDKIASDMYGFASHSEVISKFEHINNWLKDTQEHSVIVLSSDSSFNSPEKNSKPTKTNSKTLGSLSPRIKRKIQNAQTTLQHEQQMFEELYGRDLVKRLSDEVDEIISVENTQEPVEISEKVLEKIYGTVCNKDEVLTKSEPKKGRRKKNSCDKKAPKTERKKHRTSIYDVFSSSSSEDRFEEFLENVHRGKLKSLRRQNNRPSSSDFINDSESDCETSFTFYQNVLSSTVKKDAEPLRRPEVTNRRRLSFTSSQEEISESGKFDSKPKGKQKTTKINTKGNAKPRSKKRIERGSMDKANDDANGFTLVTPINIKDKKSDNHNLDVRIKHLIENELPKSVGKSKTPKNKENTEEKLRDKYLNRDKFKVPKDLKSFKTPTKSSKIDIPMSPILSFLSSLSESSAGVPCHPDALVYKKHFKEKKEELTRKLFLLYNKEVFDRQLPDNMVIEWNIRMTSTSGFCYNKRLYSNNQVFRSSRIVLSTKILDRADRLRDTLIHELCHAATWIINGTSDGHGPKWKAWADKANDRFPELPVIKRCHDYAISTKFTYKCMSCGYCIGRHSKSLNTDRKRCGFCLGRFEVFVTAKMSAASATSGSDSVKTPRNPTGFALFVKENYAAVKKENNLPHGQVMKLLSQKFAEVKISKQKEKEPVITL